LCKEFEFKNLALSQYHFLQRHFSREFDLFNCRAMTVKLFINFREKGQAFRKIIR
jgi:hypothetical protein